MEVQPSIPKQSTHLDEGRQRYQMNLNFWESKLCVWGTLAYEPHSSLDYAPYNGAVCTMGAI